MIFLIIFLGVLVGIIVVFLFFLLFGDAYYTRSLIKDYKSNVSPLKKADIRWLKTQDIVLYNMFKELSALPYYRLFFLWLSSHELFQDYVNNNYVKHNSRNEDEECSNRLFLLKANFEYMHDYKITPFSNIHGKPNSKSLDWNDYSNDWCKMIREGIKFTPLEIYNLNESIGKGVAIVIKYRKLHRMKVESKNRKRSHDIFTPYFHGSYTEF